MKKTILFLLLILTLAITATAQMSEAGSLGAGLSFTTLNYGVSGKYNFNEKHTGQVIIGSANYGLSFVGASSFSLTGRYSFNFSERDLDFATWKPFIYGQVGYWTYRYNIDAFGVRDSFNESSIAIGAGVGVEWSIKNFVDGLAFTFEAGFTNVAFDGISSIGGLNGGGGVHYYFNF